MAAATKHDESSLKVDHDPNRALKVSFRLAVMPTALHLAIFGVWLVFPKHEQSVWLVIAWLVVFVIGLGAVIFGTAGLLYATFLKLFSKVKTNRLISGWLIVATLVIVVCYVPSGMAVYVSASQLTREPSKDIREAVSRKRISLREVEQFLNDDPACVNARDENGCSPIHFAMQRGDMEVIDLLIARGADVTARTDNGATVLHFIAKPYDHRAAMIDRMIAAGVDPNAKTDGGDAPLHRAAEWASVEVVRRLLDGGADVNAMNGEGKTPLDLAEHQMQVQKDGNGFRVDEWLECIEMLREHGGISSRPADE